jgi:hypothetical protein
VGGGEEAKWTVSCGRVVEDRNERRISIVAYMMAYSVYIGIMSICMVIREYTLHGV